MRESFADICNQLTKYTNTTSCSTKLNEFDLLLSTIKSATSKSERQTRHKRDNHGMIPRALHSLIDLLFGSNTPSDSSISSNSAGVIIHETEAIKKIETQMVGNEKRVENSLSDLTKSINSDEKKIWRDLDFVTSMMQVSEAKEALLDFLNTVQSSHHLKSTLLSNDELQKMRTSINTLLNDTEVPDIKNLSDHVTFEIDDSTSNTIVIIGFPITCKTPWAKFLLFPLPNKNNTIADVDATTLTINHELTEYFQANEMTLIDTKLHMTTEVISITRSAINSPNCAIRSLAKKSPNQCPLADLPEIYDIWKTTTASNFILFYSNQPKVIICNNKKFPFPETTGYIELTSECSILTTSTIIRPSLDETTTRTYVLKIDDRTARTYNTIISSRTDPVKIFNASTAINTSEFDKAAEEALQLNTGFSKSTIIISAIAAAIATASIMFTIYYIVSKRTQIYSDNVHAAPMRSSTPSYVSPNDGTGSSFSTSFGQL